MTEHARARIVLVLNTVAFTACFAAWMMNGVLVTFFVDQRLYAFDRTEMGWLIGVPVLTGAVLRLPAGVLTDRYGGRPVFTAVLLVSAVSAGLVSFADGFWGFLLGGLAFGVAGASFAVGVAYTSVFFPRHQQGTALGIFGMGTAGAALTSLFGPQALRALTADGAHLEAWRWLPRYYAAGLAVLALAYWICAVPRRSEGVTRTLAQRLAPLRIPRVWRFGLYYVLFFGGFVALAQWLVPYYVNVYATSVGAAGALAAGFSLPSGLFRAVGGWLADSLGARRILYWVLGGCVLTFLLLAVPRMDVHAPGEGVMADADGTVTEVTPERVVVDGREYALSRRAAPPAGDVPALIWPQWSFWHEPVVVTGQVVVKRQLVARGTTHIHFQANRDVFTLLVLLLAVFLGVGMGAVFKHIPTYFPDDVGVVGGIVGVLGGLGGFVFPIVFGALLDAVGLWTSCWIVLLALALGCLGWMHAVVRRMDEQRASPAGQPALAREMEEVAREIEGLAARIRRHPEEGRT